MRIHLMHAPFDVGPRNATPLHLGRRKAPAYMAVTENVVVTARSERLPTGGEPRNPKFLGDPSQLRNELLEEGGGCLPAQCLLTDTSRVQWNSSPLVGFLDGERADGYDFSAVLAIPRS